MEGRNYLGHMFCDSGSTHPGHRRRPSSVTEVPRRLAHGRGPAGDHLLHPGETPPEHRVACHGADAWTCNGQEGPMTFLYSLLYPNLCFHVVVFCLVCCKHQPAKGLQVETSLWL